MAAVVHPEGSEDKVAFGADDGNVEEAFFLFDIAGLFGVVTGELVLGHSGDEFEAFGLVDGGANGCQVGTVCGVETHGFGKGNLSGGFPGTCPFVDCGGKRHVELFVHPFAVSGGMTAEAAFVFDFIGIFSI